jgi:hypothetical protein
MLEQTSTRQTSAHSESEWWIRLASFTSRETSGNAGRSGESTKQDEGLAPEALETCAAPILIGVRHASSGIS